MSEDQQEPDPFSHPTSGPRLFLRAVLVGALILAVVAAIVWYAANK